MKKNNIIHGFQSSVKGKSMKTDIKVAFYRRYQAMKYRCENKNDSSYSNYGGKGILAKWKSFEEFKNDMWSSFLKHVRCYGLTNTTLDRVNSKLNYEKNNCRWATRQIQGKNTKRVKNITYNNTTNSINEWSKITGFPRSTLSRRLLKYGWSPEKALTVSPPGIRGVGRGKMRLITLN